MGELVEVWVGLPMDLKTCGGSTHLYARKRDGKTIGVQATDALSNDRAVPEWQLQAKGRGWSFADAGWLARLQMAGETLPGIGDSGPGRAVASLRLAITEAEWARAVVGGSPDIELEVSQITDAGIELRLAGETFVLDYALFPWSRGVAPGFIRQVERIGRDQVRWSALDIDLPVAIMRRPEEYPRVSRPFRSGGKP
jgi:hypothetical protein